MLAQMVSFLPLRRAAATMASASSKDEAMGFSHITCLPASSASMVMRAWEALGVHMCTALIPGSASTSR